MIALVFATALAVGITSIATAGAAVSSKPQKGGNVSIIGVDVPSFNPGLMGASGAPQVGFQVYDHLIYEDPSTGEIKPELLKSFTSSPDALTWTMKLRPNVKFTDGTPLDSSAIKANIDYAANPANKHAGVVFAQEVASWDVSDPLTAKVTLKAPDAVWGHNFVLRLSMIASPTAMAKYGADYGTSVDKVVGAGPFVLSQWTRGSQMVFTRNPNYWDAPKPYLDSVTIKVIPDEQQAYNTVLTGGADMWRVPSQALLDQGNTAGLKTITFRYNSSPRSYYRFNMAKPPFNDLIARQAMAVAIDPKKLSAALGLPVATTVMDKSSVWYDPAGTFPKFDAKKAQSLIDQWSAKNGGKPMEFTIHVISGQPTQGGGGEALQAVLSGYKNLVVHVQTIDSTQVNPIGMAGSSETTASSGAAGVDPDISYRSNLLSTGNFNYGKYSSPEMDAALNAGIATTVLKDRKKAYATMQKLLMQDLPDWFMPVVQYGTDKAQISNKKIQDVKSSSWTGFMTQDMWIKS